jgi:membrane protein YqaA with SNARE-associated domain
MNNWYKRLHALTLQLASTKWGIWVLFICAFADASFLPLPVTTIFLILALLNVKKTFKYALFVVLGTVAGASAGYLIGHYAWLKPNGQFTGLVQFLFNNVPGFSEDAYNKIHHLFVRWDYWILCAAAFTPVPYGVFSILSGVFEINILIFLLTTFVTQMIKFSFLALITAKLGLQVKKFTEFSWKPAAILTGFVLVVIVVSRVL